MGPATIFLISYDTAIYLFKDPLFVSKLFSPIFIWLQKLEKHFNM